MTPKLSARFHPMMRNLLAPAAAPWPAMVALGGAAVAVGVAGYFHGRLFHEGYAHVDVVGPLFLLNVIASGVTVVMFLLRRLAMFALSALGISVGAVVSIVISHTTSFFGFAEHRYDGRALTIVIAEIVAAVLVLIGAAIARGRLWTPVAPARGRVAEVVSLVALAATILVAIGVGQGSPPKPFALSAAARAREVAAIEHASPTVRRGEQLFSAHGCDACHTIAAGGYDGRLGPRLDVQSPGTTAAAIEASILSPPRGIPGYESGLMPENFGRRLSSADIHDLATFVAAAAAAAG